MSTAAQTTNTPDYTTQAPARFHYAFAIVASCIVLTCLPCALVLSCAGIFFNPVSAYFGVPKASFTLYFSIVQLAMMASLPVWGKLMSSHDLRVCLSVGVVCAGVGYLGMSAAQAVWNFYLVGALMGIGVAPLVFLAVPTLIDAWCVKKVGFFTGLCMAFTGIGGVIFNPIGTALIGTGADGWRAAYLLFGIVILVGALPFTLFVIRSKPADKNLLPYGATTDAQAAQAAPATSNNSSAPDTQAATSATQAGVTAAEALKMPAFFAVAAFCGLITLNQTIYQFLSGYAQSFSATLPQVAAAAGVVASAAMAGQAIGKVILGIVNDRSVHAGVFFGLASGALGITLMWLFPSQLILLLAGAFLFGLVYAMTVVQTPLLVRNVFGNRDYPNIYSRVSMVGTLMGAFAAVLLGLVIDSTAGYPGMFLIGYTCMALCLVLALFALSHKAQN